MESYLNLSPSSNILPFSNKNFFHMAIVLDKIVILSRDIVDVKARHVVELGLQFQLYS